MDYKAVKRFLLLFSTITYLFGWILLISAVMYYDRNMMNMDWFFFAFLVIASLGAQNIAIRNFIQYGKMKGVDFCIDQQLKEKEESSNEY